MIINLKDIIPALSIDDTFTVILKEADGEEITVAEKVGYFEVKRLAELAKTLQVFSITPVGFGHMYITVKTVGAVVFDWTTNLRSRIETATERDRAKRRELFEKFRK